MDKERIEIFPGHWIEVTPKIKKNAGLRKSDRVLATLRNETVAAIKEIASPCKGPRKYSLLLLDEAVRIYMRDGLDKAVELTGVNRNTIKLHRRQMLIKQGKGRCRGDGNRYTLAQKQACVKLAKQLMASGEKEMWTGKAMGRIVSYERLKWSHTKAFAEAGRRLGVNGTTIESMWTQGMIPPIQQPSGR